MIDWSIRRPAVVWASAAALLLSGIMAFFRLPVATRPVVELPRLTVTAQWPGASAELVEAYVTVPLEAAVQSVRDVRRVDSESDEGGATLTVMLEPGSNVQLARLAVVERADLARRELPDGTSRPVVANYVPPELAEPPLMRYTIAGPVTPGTLARLGREVIVPRIAAVRGVAGVMVGGGAETGVSVAYDAVRLREIALAPEALAEALQSARIVAAIGNHRAGAAVVPVTLTDQPASLEALAELPVRAPAGRVLRLGDVASVRAQEDARDAFYRIDGRPAVALNVSRHPGADAIRTADAVRHEMSRLAAELPPGIVVRLQADESAALRRELSSLLARGAIALLAVAAVLVVGLGWLQPAALVLLSALVAVAGTALSLYLLGIPANLLTLAGLGMGVGILVQNGVVVVDRLTNCPADPAARAAAVHRIAPAVVGATLTTVVVLLPFLFLQGNARAAFVPFATAFALALGWSIPSSIVMIPAIAGRLDRRAGRSPQRRYRRATVRLLRWRVPALAALAILSGFALWGFVTKVPRHSFSWYGNEERLTASIHFPRGSDPQALDRAMSEFERIVVGRQGVKQATASGGPEGAYLNVSFNPGVGIEPFVLEEELTRRAVLIGGASVGVHYQGPGFYSGSVGMASSRRIKLLGYSYEGLERMARDLQRRLESIPRVRNVDINAGSFWRPEHAFEVVLRPDRRALARYGLTATDLARAVGREVAGAIGAQPLLLDGEEVRLSLKASGARDRTLEDLATARLPNPLGSPVRIGDVAGVEEREVLSHISREDQQYVRLVSYEFRGPPRLADRTHKAFMRSISLPPGYSADDEQFEWQQDDSARGLWLVFGVGLLLVVLTVAVVFDSLWATGLVFLALPVALAGSAAAFWLAGASFNREAAVGVVLVIGLAVNHLILMIDGALQRRRRGGDRALARMDGAAVIAVCRDRVRMIILVTFTALASLGPLALGTGADELFGAIALATFGGLVGATLAALLAVPALLPSWRPLSYRELK